MNGTAHKVWRKRRPTRRERKDETWCAHNLKHLRLALKYARKALREIRHGDALDGGCGYWGDVNDGFGYRETCMTGGVCDFRGGRCPLKKAMELVDLLKEK